MTEKLEGGRFSGAVRDGDRVIRRRSGPNSRALLRHFERVGFDLAPRFLGDSDDREALSFIPGEVGWPPFSEDLRSIEALVSVAEGIRDMHDHTEMFEPPAPGTWSGLEVALPVEVDCIGHHDLSPWNMVFRGREMVGIIDWDTIAPSNRAWDLAFAAYQFVPLYPPAWLEGFGWPDEPDRRERLRLFAEAYGRDISPVELIDLAVVRLSGLAAKMELEIRRGNPAFDVMRDEKHADGVRASIAYICQNRTLLVD